MTNQFTDEQVEAAAKALYELDPWLDGSDYRHLPLAWEAISDEDRDIFRPHARAALEAAAGVAPQAPATAHSPIHFECNCVPNLGPTHCHACSDEVGNPVIWSACPHAAPVQPSSTVDEGKLAEVIAQHGPGLDQTACFDGYCDCGKWIGTEEDHAAHRASAVAEWLRGAGQTTDADARILDALGFIDKTADNIATIRTRWRSGDVEELLAEIRQTLAPPTYGEHPAHCRGCPDCQGIVNAGPLS